MLPTRGRSCATESIPPPLCWSLMVELFIQLFCLPVSMETLMLKGKWGQEVHYVACGLGDADHSDQLGRGLEWSSKGRERGAVALGFMLSVRLSICSISHCWHPPTVSQPFDCIIWKMYIVMCFSSSDNVFPTLQPTSRIQKMWRAWRQQTYTACGTQSACVVLEAEGPYPVMFYDFF